MNYDEFFELKKLYYSTPRVSLDLWYGGKEMVKTIKSKKYNIESECGIRYSYARIMPCVCPTKGMEFELYDGGKLIFMNKLQSGDWSFLRPGTKTGRLHINPAYLLKANGKDIYEISPILSSLLEAIQ